MSTKMCDGGKKTDHVGFNPLTMVLCTTFLVCQLSAGMPAWVGFDPHPKSVVKENLLLRDTTTHLCIYLFINIITNSNVYCGVSLRKGQ